MFGGRTFHFYLSIPRSEMLRFYRGSAQTVEVRTQEGLTLELSAYHLRPFMTPEGVHGRFELKVSSANKFVSLKQLT